MPFMLAAGKLVLLAALAHSAAAQIPHPRPPLAGVVQSPLFAPTGRTIDW
jgi:hypothetical protein